MFQKCLILFLTISVLFSCKKRKTEEADVDAFDRTTMLTSYSDDIIQPSLLDFKTTSDSLYNAVLVFTQNPTPNTLDSAQAKLRTAAISWQYCSAFRIGPIQNHFGSLDDGAKREDYINTFPADVSIIEKFISLNNSNLKDIDFPSKGLNAIDYLLNTLDNNDSSVVSKFVTSNSRKEYLKTLALDIKTRASNAHSSWQSFRGEFISNNGTSASSSVSTLIMQFIIDYETLKNLEIGFPVGRILTTSTLTATPEKAQFYYMGNSLELAMHHLLAIEKTWYGKDGKGLKLYLESADGGKETAEATVAQINKVKEKFALIPNERLSTLVATNKQPVSDYYTEILKLTHFFKSDMPSRLGIYITYASGDGD